MNNQLMEEKTNEKKKKTEHKFVLVGNGIVECIGCELKHGGLINTGREELREDGHIYAIRDFDKYKAGQKII